MPVRKFRSIEEMTPPSPQRRSDPENLAAAITWSLTCVALDGRRHPAGVRKYRSLEEAQQARLRWERS